MLPLTKLSKYIYEPSNNNRKFPKINTQSLGLYVNIGQINHSVEYRSNKLAISKKSNRLNNIMSVCYYVKCKKLISLRYLFIKENDQYVLHNNSYGIYYNDSLVQHFYAKNKQ
jgi:hypothetical protein